MHANYTGPSALNNAFHAAPHITAMSGSFVTFVVDPANVKANPADYMQSAAFMPAIVLVLGTLLMLTAFIAQCCRCPCSKATRRCCNCPKLLQLDTRNPCSDKCYFATLLTFGALILAAAIAAISIQYALASSLMQVSDTAMDIKDAQDQMTAQLQLIEQQTQVQVGVSDELVALATAASPPLPVYIQAAAQYTAVSALEASETASSAVSKSKLDLSIKSTVDQMRNAVVWFRVASAVLFAATCGLLAGSFTGTFGADSGPVRPCQDATESLQIILFWLVVLVGVVPLLYIAIVGGDLCQNPTGYLNEITPDNEYTEFYVNCPPNAVSPVEDDLTTAYLAVLASQAAAAEVIVYTQPNATYAQIYQTAQQLYEGDTSTLVDLNTAISNSGCYTQHARVVSIEMSMCGNVFDLLAATLYLLCVYISLPLVFNCIVPRRAPNSYKKLATTTTTTPTPT